MARYVFDFDKINNTIKVLNDKTSSINSCLNDYSNKISNSISAWDSTTKNKFIELNSRQLEFLKMSVKDMVALAKYLDCASKNIESLEQSLASMKI